MSGPRFIVAEVSKSWLRGEPYDPANTQTIGMQFEHVIDVNDRRGFRLNMFQYTATPYDTVEGEALNETIIAVFERVQ